jgi:hypothetical protein
MKKRESIISEGDQQIVFELTTTFNKHKNSMNDTLVYSDAEEQTA